jgi:3-dehydroquinate synthase
MKIAPDLVVEHASGQYPVYVNSGWLEALAGLVASSGCSRAIVVTDENVDRVCGGRFKAALASTGCIVNAVAIPAGEASKSLDQAARLYRQLQESGADRRATIIALGGGVVGDLAGFVAATWMRGIRLIQIPTTLVAQVDSSIGGKTGVNLPGIKNAVGAFWQPEFVGIDTSLLLTLPENEYTSGLGEVVKYGLILDAELLQWLLQNAGAIRNREPAVLAAVVRRCCRLKADIVRDDERETTGLRSILNYGHTFGHAIESVFGYGEWKHGHAVAAGMMAAARLAVAEKTAAPELVGLQKSVLRALDIPHAFPKQRHAELLEAMRHDKKSQNGALRLVLLTGAGEAKLVSDIRAEAVLKAMSATAEEDA